MYGTEVLDRYLDCGLNERGHGRHDRIGKEHADFDRLTALDLNRTEWPRFETTAESGSREHHESEYQALSDEKQSAHFNSSVGIDPQGGYPGSTARVSEW